METKEQLTYELQFFWEDGFSQICIQLWEMLCILLKKKSEMKKDQNSRSANDIIKPLQKLIDMGKQNWTSR